MLPQTCSIALGIILCCCLLAGCGRQAEQVSPGTDSISNSANGGDTSAKQSAASSRQGGETTKPLKQTAEVPAQILAAPSMEPDTLDPFLPSSPVDAKQTAKPIDLAATLDQLVEAAKDPMPEQWEKSYELLRLNGEQCLPVFAEALKSDDRLKKEISSMMLGEWILTFDPDWPLDPEIAKVALADESEVVRVNVASLLLTDLESHEMLRAPLRELTKSGDESVRLNAACALSNIEGESELAWSCLRSFLASEAEEQCVAALLSVGNLNSLAEEIVPVVLAKAKSDSIPIRIECAHTLTRLAPEHPDVIALLKQMAQDEGPAEVIRQTGAQLLEGETAEIEPAVDSQIEQP